MKESSVQQRIRLDAAQGGVELFRNNSGACVDQTGRLIRYGLANDSAAVNAKIKSSDLIGIVPIFITPNMVGQILGRFVAVECKPSGWHGTPSDERALAQSAFHDIIKKAGGCAGFATCVEDYRKIVGR